MKKPYTFIRVAALGATLALALGSCKKDFLDVNRDPNNAANTTPDLALPAAEAFLAYDLGNHFHITGGLFSEYYTQGAQASQYKAWEQYRLDQADFDRPWDDLYTGTINDLDNIIATAKATYSNPATLSADKQVAGEYLAIAYFLKAMTYQTITDNWGNIPIAQANKGLDSTVSPKFDPGQQVYDSLEKFVRTGLAFLDDSYQSALTGDLIYPSTGPTDTDALGRWHRFANTLLLRIYIRQSLVPARDAIVRAGIASLFNDQAGFVQDGESALIKFVNTQFNRNPFWETLQSLGSGNLIASNTAINYFNGVSDPRLAVVYVPATSGPNNRGFAGLDQGAGLNTLNTSLPATNFALPSPFTGGRPTSDQTSGATAPVILLSDWESHFLQAEALARGLVSGGGEADAKTAYEAGIAASFAYQGLADDPAAFAASDSVAFPLGDAENQFRHIITQKWAAMCGLQNNEAWAEYRRTKYPKFLIPSTQAIAGNGKLPERVPYPTTEQTRNANFPGLVDIFTPIWWSVR